MYKNDEMNPRFTYTHTQTHLQTPRQKMEIKNYHYYYNKSLYLAQTRMHYLVRDDRTEMQQFQSSKRSKNVDQISIRMIDSCSNLF